MAVSGQELETEVVIQPECGRMAVCKAFRATAKDRGDVTVLEGSCLLHETVSNVVAEGLTMMFRGSTAGSELASVKTRHAEPM